MVQMSHLLYLTIICKKHEKDPQSGSWGYSTLRYLHPQGVDMAHIRLP